ncbi:PLP-dependent aminotransferase family protein [Lentzea albida]|uniref:DNA-binding transcriptional regulator, MocR family, contains an aminotransferase domain n=1 Tax=Lentzea albida TaxID=65499 RepID=A0A1H9GAW1_9PSEU|nr:PLP-dependent aminotransferase family protein [Lentzea albida]SEQ47219.1 DNA-binding transcriptional regulator, MocR family, contains an aminotransferase domain [Lentzea albida]
MEDYRRIADAVAADIAAGRLRPGDRLPPQRAFARRRRIASSTAARVYGELARRGLVVGEVGRGTFVRAVAGEPALADPGGAPVDLQLNFPVLPEQAALLSASLAAVLRPDVLAEALRAGGATGTAAARTAAADLLARTGWRPSPERILVTGNGKQSLAATIAALVPVGGRLGVEALTYPVVRTICARLGVAVVPLEMDEHGVVPDSLRAAAVRAVYLQPVLHNPLGVTMPAHRRAEVVAVLEELDVPLIEDAVYTFLSDDPPLAALAPDRTVLVDSLSKRVAPGLTLGFVVPPAHLFDEVAAAVRAGGWTASRFAVEVAAHLIADGTAAAVQQAKRADAMARQRLVAEKLDVRADPRSYHCWWELPPPWRADTFTAAAAREGIAVTPAAAFAVGAAPNAVRLALASPPVDRLGAALDVLARIARGTPDLGS